MLQKDLILYTDRETNYNNVLLNGTLMRHKMRSIRSVKHQLGIESQTQRKCVSRFLIRAKLWRLLGRLLGKPIESQTQRKCVSRFLIKRYLGRLLGRPLGIPNATQMCVAFFNQEISW